MPVRRDGMDALPWALQALGFVLLGLGVVLYVMDIRRERRRRYGPD